MNSLVNCFFPSRLLPVAIAAAVYFSRFVSLRLPCKPPNWIFMLLRLWPHVFWRAWFDWHVPTRGSYSTVRWNSGRGNGIDWTQLAFLRALLKGELNGVNISSWKRGEHGKRKCVQKQQPAIYMVLVQTGSQIHMDFDGQSSNAHSANLILVPTLATRMSGNRTWDGRQAAQISFVLLWWSDTIQREDAIAVIFLHQANGLRMTRISWEEFQCDRNCGSPISNKLILAVFRSFRIGNPPQMARVWWNTSWWAALTCVAIGWQLLPFCSPWFFQILKMLP